jgi:ABC-type amino acid transport substrate-binding protein
MNLAIGQTKVPLLFGENKNEKGEMIPIPERFIKIFHAIENDLGIEFQLQIYPWNRAVKIASSDGGIIFGLSVTPDREKIFTFSEPATYHYIWLVTRKDKQFSFKSLQDLKGKTIGIVRGSKYGGEFDEQKNILFKTDDDIDAYGPRLSKVLNQRIDAMIFASPLTNYKEVEDTINKIILTDDHQLQLPPGKRFAVLPVPVLKDGIRFASLIGQNDRLIKDINKSLKKIQGSNSNKQNKAK